METFQSQLLENNHQCLILHTNDNGNWSQFHQHSMSSYAHADPESAKNTAKSSVFFALLGSGRVKAVRKMLVKLTPGNKSF